MFRIMGRREEGNTDLRDGHLSNNGDFQIQIYSKKLLNS